MNSSNPINRIHAQTLVMHVTLVELCRAPGRIERIVGVEIVATSDLRGSVSAVDADGRYVPAAML